MSTTTRDQCTVSTGDHVWAPTEIVAPETLTPMCDYARAQIVDLVDLPMGGTVIWAVTWAHIRFETSVYDKGGDTHMRDPYVLWHSENELFSALRRVGYRVEDKNERIMRVTLW